MDTYVIMKQRMSPCYITYPEPHLVVFSRKQANRICKELEARAARNEYWVQKVKNVAAEDGE